MYSIISTNQFRKDIKLCKKRNYKIELMNSIVLSLEATGSLASRYKSHKLAGNYKDYWECHIQPDWLLIWTQNENLKTIHLIRTGTHSDLF